KELDVALDELLAQSKSNPTFAQTLAVDASALLGRGQDGLADIANKGFFKRLWSSVSGKTAAASRATIQDVVKMQDLSWRYLQAVQAQGLIELRTLTIIRANLAQLARADGRTARLVGLVADKLEDVSRRQDATEQVV